jgi:hypothetical protein
MKSKGMTKEEIKRALKEGKTIRTRRHGSSEGNRMEEEEIVVTPRIGGREMNDVRYATFDIWYDRDMAPYPEDEIEVI